MRSRRKIEPNDANEPQAKNPENPEQGYGATAKANGRINIKLISTI
jgi:hypothetical protein